MPSLLVEITRVSSVSLRGIFTHNPLIAGFKCRVFNCGDLPRRSSFAYCFNALLQYFC